MFTAVRSPNIEVTIREEYPFDYDGEDDTLAHPEENHECRTPSDLNVWTFKSDDGSWRSYFTAVNNRGYDRRTPCTRFPL